jgi:hypothetical protein
MDGASIDSLRDELKNLNTDSLQEAMKKEMQKK